MTDPRLEQVIKQQLEPFWSTPGGQIFESAVRVAIAGELRRLAPQLCTNDAQVLERRAFELDPG